jgi:hypothetical protein
MKLRPGRKNPRNLYLQLGGVPADDDPCIGLLIDPGVAAVLGDALTDGKYLDKVLAITTLYRSGEL